MLSITPTTLILFTMIIYLGGMILIGVIFSKKNKSSDDFFLGGRHLGPFVAAMSAEASDISSYLLMGIPGVALYAGLADAGWTVIGLAIGTYVNWLLVAKKLRNYSHKIHAITVPEFFSKRYHDDKNVLSLIAALVIIIFFIPYTASGFNACGTLFSSLFGVDYFKAMLLSAIVLIIYVTLGGFLAASTSDFIQSIIMSIALIVIIFFGISTAGGWNAVMANASSMPGYLNMFMGHDYASGTAGTYGPITILSTLAWGLGYFGMPHILLRFMAIEDPAKLKTSRRVASIWVVISMAVAILIGVVGNAMIANGSIDALAPADSQRIIIAASTLLSQNGFLAAIIAGVILSGILAATMSTADSQLLAAASSISQDIVQDTLKIKLSQKQSLAIARVTIILVAVVAIIWAREEGSVFSIVSFAWAGFGAAFGPVMLLALFWKKSNKWGAFAGMLTGGIMIFVWKYLVRPLGGAWDIYELLPAFIFALAANVIVSIATGGAEKEVQDEFEAFRSEN